MDSYKTLFCAEFKLSISSLPIFNQFKATLYKRYQLPLHFFALANIFYCDRWTAVTCHFFPSIE